MVGLKKKKEKEKTNTVIYAKISPKMVNPRDIAGDAEEEEEEEEKETTLSDTFHSLCFQYGRCFSAPEFC